MGNLTMRAIVLAIIMSCAFSASAAPLTREDMVDAAREVAGELQECSVYFIMGSTCIAGQEPELSKTYRQLADRVGLLSFQVGRSFGLSDEAFGAMASLHMENMRAAIKDNCINIAVLLRKYSKFCQRLTQDADPRLKEWMACKQARTSPCPGGPL